MSRASRRWVVVVFVLGASLGRGARAVDPPKPNPAGKVFVGYLFGSPRALNYGLYTHLCHAFLVPDAEGRVRGTRGVPDRAFLASARKEGVEVLVSVGGWDWDREFAAIVAKPDAEKRLVDEVMRFVVDNDYDGIDLDWEYPDTEAEVAGFARLTRAFRSRLDALARTRGRPIRLTMASAANPPTIRWLPTELLVETMDWVNLMTYDFSGDWSQRAGHHAPMYPSTKLGGAPRSVSGSVDYFLDERKLPPDKLALGIPLYGKGFPVGEPNAPTRGVSRRRLPRGDYANLVRLEREEKWTRLRDDETKTPWLIAPDKSAVIGFDDPESAASKTDWAMKRGLRGVFFWQVNGDRLPDGSNPIQEAARRRWLDGASVGPTRPSR